MTAGRTGGSPVVSGAAGRGGLDGDGDGDAVMVGERSGLVYHTLRPEWAAEVAALEQASYPTADPVDLYDTESILVLAEDFSEGCFVGFDDGRVAAMGVGVRTTFDFDHPQHRVADIVERNDRSGDDPDGDWYYGTGIAVYPEYRRRGIGREMYELRKQVCVDLGLCGIVAGGVIPGYADHKHEMSADDYIDRVRAGELTDPTLTFQLDSGFEVICALENYMIDPAVDHYASLIVWRRPDDAASDDGAAFDDETASDDDGSGGP